jgi:hypothetical protein
MAAWDDPIGYQRSLEAKLSRVRELAADWAEYGPSLVRNAHGGSDVTEGLALERCASLLCEALGDQ